MRGLHRQPGERGGGRRRLRQVRREQQATAALEPGWVSNVEIAAVAAQTVYTLSDAIAEADSLIAVRRLLWYPGIDYTLTGHASGLGGVTLTFTAAPLPAGGTALTVGSDEIEIRLVRGRLL